MNKQNGDWITFLKQKDYIMINNNLGDGSFGKTVLLQDPFIDEFFVAKMYKPIYEDIREKFYENFLDEIKILYKLNNPNVVRIYNYYAYEKECTGYILMEYIKGKTIEEYFREYIGLWEPSSLDQVFSQLIDGFSYIEKQGIIHRDIREGNILIDEKGIVKIIDFGIGKVFEKTNLSDSLVDDINRSGSDTLPHEYYQGIYTSKTDMFYLAELFNRMLGTVSSEHNDFSYSDILEKMMKKYPDERYTDFEEIKNVISKRDFSTMHITAEDKEIYLRFANMVFSSLHVFINKRDFNLDETLFVSKLQNAIETNLFEEYIQKNEDVICAIVSGTYRYSKNINMPCSAVKDFLNWFKKLTLESQRLVLRNIVSKLSVRDIEYEYEELPFN